MGVFHLAPSQPLPIPHKLAATAIYTNNDALKMTPAFNYKTKRRTNSNAPFSISATFSSSSPAIDKPVCSPPSQTPGPLSTAPLLRVSPFSLKCESGYLVPNPPLREDNGAVREDSLTALEYLTNILSSKVYEVAYESPLQHATKLSDRWGVNVWLKREDFQPVRFCFCFFFSFLKQLVCMYVLIFVG